VSTGEKKWKGVKGCKIGRTSRAQKKKKKRGPKPHQLEKDKKKKNPYTGNTRTLGGLECQSKVNCITGGQEPSNETAKNKPQKKEKEQRENQVSQREKKKVNKCRSKLQLKK